MAASILQMGICPGKRDRLADAPRTGKDPEFHDRAIEVRDADAIEKLLGWVLGKWTRNCRPPGLPVINFAGELATDSLGASMGCTGPGTLLATELLRTEVRVDRHIATTLPGAGKQFDPRDLHPYPDYAHHEFIQELMMDAIEVESSWRFLPVTMAQFDWLFDRAEFVPAGDEVREVSGLNWATGPAPKTSRPTLGGSYRTAPVAHLPDPKTTLLDAISATYDPSPDLSKFVHATTTTTSLGGGSTINIHSDPELLKRVSQEMERFRERQFLDLYRPFQTVPHST